MDKIEENNKKGEDNKIYEVGYHIIPIVAVENISNEVENINNFLIKEGAVIVSEEFPEMRDLAFAMSKSVGGSKRKFDTAYFGWTKFDAGEASIAKIKKFFDENENILRFILIQTVKEDTLFSPISPKIPPSPSKEEPKTTKNLAEKEIKSPISEEELDKTIDKLIAE